MSFDPTTFDRDYQPPVETTLALIDAGVIEELAFGQVGTSTIAKVHIMRWWPEDNVPADIPLQDLGPHQIRAFNLYIPYGNIGWGLCGKRIVVDNVRDLFTDERLCWKCRDILADGNEERVLLAYKHAVPEQL